MQVCGSKKCTACGACLNICPLNCIQYENDRMDAKIAYIDKKRCIECGLCQKVCPILTPPKTNQSILCYAGWSLNTRTRLTCASGGVATEFYRYASANGIPFAGVKLNSDFEAVYILEKKDWKGFKNSKYVYSNTNSIFKQIYKQMELGEDIVFIGLPCQVAALRNYLDTLKCNKGNLLTIDLICHGVTPVEYLKDHIMELERKYAEKTTEILFRNPIFYTYTYTFTLKNLKKIFYKRAVKRNDAYQIGYHNGIAYRDSCYQCTFSSTNRTGDITLADFGGVGTKKECLYDNKNVSCILVNTEKGLQWIHQLLENNYLYLEERPIEEVYDTEERLHSPTPIPKEREKFVKYYLRYRCFDKAMAYAAKKIILKNELCWFFHIEDIKKIVAAILPVTVKKIMKQIMEL